MACAEHGQVEFLAAVHRKLREGSLSPTDQHAILAQFDLDQQTSVVKWLTLTPQVFDRASRSFRNLPPSVFLRSSDALHLACAAENGFAGIYSNDRHLLAAASHFGLTGINIL
ncbi:MAG: type II toxin-antitoxin system VapC family toxin [Planctomycetia bacterium]|nr:type II toxin-antitoxin system VapC family toxin [Planctomycetia bacterium]